MFVQDIQGCGTISFIFDVVIAPNFFTPNSDGINDLWALNGLYASLYTKVDIQIYDRFGKLLKVLTLQELGWDGTYNGQNLPSTDYWYTVTLLDREGNIRTKRGHFSLIRR